MSTVRYPYESLSQAWVQEMRMTMVTGDHVSPRGIPTVERRWARFQVSDPTTIPIDVTGRRFRHEIGLLEALSIIGQFSVPELFTERVPRFEDFMDEGILYGSYGARVHGSLDALVDVLRRDSMSRQAVLTVFDSTRDLGRSSRDIPCTVALQFLVRDHRLSMQVTMRSNDLWLGTPYDLMQFAITQCVVADRLGVGVGEYVHVAGSLHLYDRDREKASSVIVPADPGRSFALPLLSRKREVASSARSLAIWPEKFNPQTEFEDWARGVLL